MLTLFHPEGRLYDIHRVTLAGINAGIGRHNAAIRDNRTRVLALKVGNNYHPIL